MMSFKYDFVAVVCQTDIEPHQCNSPCRLRIDRSYLEPACQRVPHEDRLSETGALLNERNHGVLDLSRHWSRAKSRHRHHKQAMRQPLSETRPGGKGIVVMDRMVVARDIGKRPELVVSDSAGFADKGLSYGQIVSKDLCRSPVAHFFFSSFACTTTGSNLRVRSLWISTILADWLPSLSVALKVVGSVSPVSKPFR